MVRGVRRCSFRPVWLDVVLKQNRGLRRIRAGKGPEHAKKWGNGNLPRKVVAVPPYGLDSVVVRIYPMIRGSAVEPSFSAYLPPQTTGRTHPARSPHRPR